MAGIYIHIPFCKCKCHYCNFFSLASQKQKEPFLSAMLKEIDLTKEYLQREPVHTIYFGGGTPSLYHPEQLQEIIAALTNIYPLQNNCEITIEINPEDLTPEFVGQLKESSFNRFSIGIQSFFDEELNYLGRNHSAEQGLDSIKLLQDKGFRNISIDLIYGIPGTTPESWQKNLDLAFALEVPHISCYALTIEQKTPLSWMINQKKAAPVDDESQTDQLILLMEKAEGKGFLQYEISNFCKPGHHAIHNTNYWKGVPYLGLGPSAHSFNRISRRWNVANLTDYLNGISNGTTVFNEEILTTNQQYNEYVMTSLRTMWGCRSEKIISDFGMSYFNHFSKNAIPLIDFGLLMESEGIFLLTAEGKLFADRIASDLFLTA